VAPLVIVVLEEGHGLVAWDETPGLTPVDHPGRI
jgi:hypothetical protein